MRKTFQLDDTTIIVFDEETARAANALINFILSISEGFELTNEEAAFLHKINDKIELVLSGRQLGE